MQYKQKYKQIRGFTKFDFRINQFEDGIWEIEFCSYDPDNYGYSHEDGENLAELLMLVHNKIIDEDCFYLDHYEGYWDEIKNLNPQKGIGFNFYFEDDLWYVEFNACTYTGKDLFEILVRIDDEPIPRTKKKRKS